MTQATQASALGYEVAKMFELGQLALHLALFFTGPQSWILV